MKKQLIPVEQIARTILFFREEKVLLDSDLARLFVVTTGNLNKAVSRNRDRFPADFMFRLRAKEVQSWGGQRHLSFAFTEQGVAMLSSVLNSERAIKVNIAIMRAFVRLETNRALARKFAEFEKHVGERTRLACWRWRPRHRALVSRRGFSAGRQKENAGRMRSPIR
jgi:hypothetical protein